VQGRAGCESDFMSSLSLETYMAIALLVLLFKASMRRKSGDFQEVMRPTTRLFENSIGIMMGGLCSSMLLFSG
jgi:hypothetical protein